MAELFSFGQPENESERKAFEYLRTKLPDSYKLFTNLEIKQGVDIYEIDLVIMAPHCVYVVDIKNWHGSIDIYDPNWHPDNYQPFISPLKKLRKHAKVLSSAICDVNRARQNDLREIHIQASVLMADVNIKITDYGDRDGAHVTYLDERCLKYFKDKSYIPEYRLDNIKPYIFYVERAITGRSSPKSALLRYRDWQVEEKISENELCQYTEYRAKSLTIGMNSLTARLRVYKVDPLLEPAERQKLYKLISTSFLAVQQLPSHSNILNIKEFFESPEHNCLVMVTEDVEGQALRQHIKKQSLSWERKIAIIKDVLRGLKHAHKHSVIHRNITPDTVLVTAKGQARLIGFDYARISNRTSTISDDIIDELEQYAAYQAIECQSDPAQASVASDLFSAGLVFYELLTGSPAFTSAEQIYECSAQFPNKPSQLKNELSNAWDNWLQKMCAFDPLDRYSNAGAALKELNNITTPATQVNDNQSHNNKTNLQAGDIIDDRYQVIKRLGRPGSFAVAYHVLDTTGDVELVLKLITRDKLSVYERLQQEYKILQKVPNHPHIVKVTWAGLLKDDTPFIAFEYVDGQDVETLIENKTLSKEKAVEIAKQTASGLLHLHKHQVRHQDIKPSNIILTDKGIRIIDFNISVSDSDEITKNAGTKRYMPPDYKLTAQTLEDKTDRDLYALGIVFYECVTGRYPFDEAQPPRDKLPINPCTIEGCEDLSDELVQLLMQIIAPKRKDRFTNAEEIITAINNLTLLNLTPQPPSLQGKRENSKPLSSQERGLERGSKYTSQTASSTHFNLFNVQSTHTINPDKPIILDPTGVYEIPPSYIHITTEVEWMRSFGTSDSPCWFKGRRLCDWAKEWLRVWDKLELIAEEKQSPRLRLQQLFEHDAIPNEWTDAQLLILATKLDSYPQENPIAYLLADATQTDKQIWLAAPSVENLAAWLAIQVPQECKVLEQVWQYQHHHELVNYYQTEDKLALLRRWLGIAQPIITELPQYPFLIPSVIEKEFDDYWEKKIYQSEAKILDEIIPSEQVGFARIAQLAFSVFNKRPKFSNKTRENKLASYLNHQQQLTLRDKRSPLKPEPLALDATSEQALSWVTEKYLPFRRWAILLSQTSSERIFSERLANSFMEWMLQHYPKMKFDAVEHSQLNYSVASRVQNLIKSSPVLWVVVDGLGWLDHIELLDCLANNQLAVERDIEPRFSILPTKTEYAKWSLYAQLLPNASSWVDNNAGKAFSFMGLGERYTDGRTDKLLQDLKTAKHKLYCWDTEQFDKLYHNERDWHHLYNVKRRHTLEGIAKEIQSFVEAYPQPEDMQIVIASDHGQLLGITEKILCNPGDVQKLEIKGRIAIGKTDDPRLVVLERDSYGLPHDISVVRGAASLRASGKTGDTKFISSHGGLFPEEVVVGVSVLRKSVQRRPVLVTCSGEGEALKTGNLIITIDNPNSVPLTNLYLYITSELCSLKLEIPIEAIIPANDKLTLFKTIPIPNFPTTYQENTLTLSLGGKLSFQFPGALSASYDLSTESCLTITRIYNSGFDIDDLKDFF